MKRVLHKARVVAVMMILLLALQNVSGNTGLLQADAAQNKTENRDTANSDSETSDEENNGESREEGKTEENTASEQEKLTTPTPTPKPTKTPTPKPTKTPEATEKPTATPKPTKTPDATEKPTATPKPTKAPEATEKPTPTPKPTKAPEATEKPTATPKPTKTPDATEKPTATPKPTKTPEDGNTDTVPTGEPENGEVTPTATPKPTNGAIVPTESNVDRYQYLFGMDPREITMDTPPEGFETQEAAAAQMTTITVPVWKMAANGERYESTYKLTINKKLAKNVKAIFKDIFALDIKFPIKYMNGFYYRKVGGVGLSRSTLMSVHSFGAAIDINPGDYDNDYFLGKGNDLRDKSNPYCIPDEVIEVFKNHGWFWGGEFEICADTMHFQYLGLEMLHYQGNSPFRTLKVKQGYMTGNDVRNLQQRLCELGYRVTIDGVYGNKTAAAIKRYQKKRGLLANGVVDYKTWETIINETHYMSYVF